MTVIQEDRMKGDTPFTQVQLGELPKWLGRRRMTPNAMLSGFSRALHRYHDKYVRVKNGGPRVFYLHWWMASFAIMYYLHYDRHYVHRHHKYH